MATYVLPYKCPIQYSRSTLCCTAQQHIQTGSLYTPLLNSRPFLFLLKSFETFAKDKIIHFKRCEGDRARSRAYYRVHILCNRDLKRSQEIWKSTHCSLPELACLHFCTNRNKPYGLNTGIRLVAAVL